VSAGLRAREHTENFPVALRVLPRRHRDDLHAVYAFARTVDELGDSAPGDRTALLQDFDTELNRVWTDATVTDPVLHRLRTTVRAHRLRPEPFHRLVQANLQDQRIRRYRSFEDLLGYCRLSADPVGRIVLGVFERHDPALLPLSDRVCTALQLLEHWQDIGEDARAGRIYLPQDDLAEHGVPESALLASTTSPELRALIRFEVDRAARLLREGSPIVGRLDGWARVCVGGFVAGGAATAAAFRRSRGEVLARVVRPSRPGTVARLAVALVGGSSVWEATT